MNRRPEKSINSKRTELQEFAKFCEKVYVEEIKRTDLIAYRNHLLDAGQAPVTALNKLMSVSTWPKKNPVVSITGLLKAEDWPRKPDTEPRPHTGDELKPMMDAASPKERLLLRFFLGTGMREQEIAHAEVSDIKNSYIQVQAKPEYGWSPKTDAGTRKIPLGDALVADLRRRRQQPILTRDGYCVTVRFKGTFTLKEPAVTWTFTVYVFGGVPVLPLLDELLAQPDMPHKISANSRPVTYRRRGRDRFCLAS